MKKSLKYSFIVSIILLITIVSLATLHHLNYLDTEVCSVTMPMSYTGGVFQISPVCDNPSKSALTFGIKLGIFCSILSFFILKISLDFRFKKKKIKK